MGAKGGGSGSKTYDVWGIAACAVCVGPVKRLIAIVIDDKNVWPAKATDPVLTRSTDNQNGASIDVPGRGPLQWYWGTQTQQPDPTLNNAAVVGTELHPAYPGVCYAVLGGGAPKTGFLFGRERQPAPNIQFVVEREPEDAAGIQERVNVDGQANPIAALISIYLQSQPAADWPGYNPATWDVAASLAVAGPNGQNAVGVSPFLSSPVDLSEAARTLGVHADCHVTVDASTGQILPVVRNHLLSTVVAVATLDANEQTEPAKLELTSQPGDTTSWAVVFADRTRNWKDSAEVYNNAAARLIAGETRREFLQRPWITRRAQAQWHAQEWDRARGADVLSATLNVLSATAINWKTGDWINLDISWTTDVSVFRSFWITEITRPAHGPTQIKCESDGTRTSTTGAPSVDPTVTGDLPPPLPIGTATAVECPVTLANGDSDNVLVLAERPDVVTIGMQVYYTGQSGSAVPVLVGSPRFFPLRGTVAKALGTADDTWALATVPTDGTMPPLPATHPLQVTFPTDHPDSAWVKETTGVDAANNNQMLLFLCGPGGTTMRPMETFSVGQIDPLNPPVGSNITYAVRALRGRFNNPATAAVGDVAFLLPARHLDPIFHADFPTLRVQGTAGFLRLLAYTASAIRQFTAGTDAQVVVTFDGISATAPVILWSAPAWPADGSPFPVAATGTAVPLSGQVTDSEINLVSIVLTAIRPDATEMPLLTVPLVQTGFYVFSATFTPDVSGRWVVRAVATDGGGQVTVSTRPVDVGAVVPGVTPPPIITPHGGTNVRQIKITSSVAGAQLRSVADTKFLASAPDLGLWYPVDQPFLYNSFHVPTRVWAQARINGVTSVIVQADFYMGRGW